MNYTHNASVHLQAKEPVDFYDSNTGKLLFSAPVGRTMEAFLVESKFMQEIQF